MYKKSFKTELEFNYYATSSCRIYICNTVYNSPTKCDLKNNFVNVHTYRHTNYTMSLHFPVIHL